MSPVTRARAVPPSRTAHDRQDLVSPPRKPPQPLRGRAPGACGGALPQTQPSAERSRACIHEVEAARGALFVDVAFGPRGRGCRLGCGLRRRRRSGRGRGGGGLGLASAARGGRGRGAGRARCGVGGARRAWLRAWCRLGLRRAGARARARLRRRLPSEGDRQQVRGAVDHAERAARAGQDAEEKPRPATGMAQLAEIGVVEIQICKRRHRRRVGGGDRRGRGVSPRAGLRRCDRGVSAGEGSRCGGWVGVCGAFSG